MRTLLTVQSDLNSLGLLPSIIFSSAQKIRIFAIVGTLGAGKTTLVKSLLSYYGICPADVISPTFTYYNVYKDANGKSYYHFDLYRIQSIESFCDMGFHEYLYDQDLFVFIEWPDVILPLLRDQAVCQINIDYSSQINQRVLTIKVD